MRDGVTESYLVALEECRAERDEWVARADAAINELRERNEDLREWRPKVEALAELVAGAREYVQAADTGAGPCADWLARADKALAEYRGERP